MFQHTNIQIRKATERDIDAIACIYAMIHQLEAEGKVSIGWDPKLYPVRSTAETALAEDELFVMETEGIIIASAIINHNQPSSYKLPAWQYEAPDEKVGVLHTLVVHPDFGHMGYGRMFVAFFEEYCKNIGCEVVRLDTQEQNTRPLKLYPQIGYRLAGIYDTSLFDYPKKIRLALFEKQL